MKFKRAMFCELPDIGTEVLDAHVTYVHAQQVGEPFIDHQIRTLATALGLSEYDLEMIQAITDDSLYSPEALESRWPEKPQQHLSVVA